MRKTAWALPTLAIALTAALTACGAGAPDPRGFAGFGRQAVRDVAAWGGGKVQVGEELNCPAPLDGGSPGCFEAVGAGVAAALEERDRTGAPVLVGVNAAGVPDPAFWDQFAGAIGPHNTRRLDYVGLDAFPDVFRPISHQNLTGAVTSLVQRADDAMYEAKRMGRNQVQAASS